MIKTIDLKEKKAKGDIPLSPYSIASGLYSAANNLKEESIYAISDDIARKLLKKLPNPEFQLINDGLEFAHNKEYKKKAIEESRTIREKFSWSYNFKDYIK